MSVWQGLFPSVNIHANNVQYIHFILAARLPILCLTAAVLHMKLKKKHVECRQVDKVWWNLVYVIMSSVMNMTTGDMHCNVAVHPHINLRTYNWQWGCTYQLISITTIGLWWIITSQTTHQFAYWFLTDELFLRVWHWWLSIELYSGSHSITY